MFLYGVGQLLGQVRASVVFGFECFDAQLDKAQCNMDLFCYFDLRGRLNREH